jgi:hypothetical protein
MIRWGVSGHIDLALPTRRLVAAELMRHVAAVIPADEELVGVTSLAGGADQVFAWVVTALGGRLEFVRPCARIEDTVTGYDLRGMQAGAVLAEHTEILDFDEPSEQAFLAAGMAVLERSDRLVAIYDGLPARSLGGTGDIVQAAREQGKPVTEVWPAGARRG